MLLLLDQYPKSKFKKIITFLKIFIKEGLLHKHWDQVFRNRSVGGSYAFPQNLSLGLTQINYPYRHNNYDTNDVEIIGIIKDTKCVKWAITQKSQGKIKKIVAGPLVVSHPHESSSIIMSPEIDVRLVPSEWVRKLFLRDEPKLNNIQIWSCGVDHNYWLPQQTNPENILIYYKNPEPQLYEKVVSRLRALELPYETIYYGKYDHTSYKQALSKSKLVIFLSRTETQGLAMFEAWSSNVPTLHWNCKSWQWMGRSFNQASSCPYLTNQCGYDFDSIENFSIQLDKALINLKNFTPREFILSGHTLAHAAKNYIKYL
jgi:hypothetical protein